MKKAAKKPAWWTEPAWAAELAVLEYTAEDTFEDYIEFWYFMMPQHKTWRVWRH